ncbi:hypothetical protein CERSUDRAFT_112682 [Gelatoporia subvermispora B]|uniref:Uncharacterized protein n=1 Tax=Ceriporiopsis subvermispora (strain B) TaxID=914234 RepID=M2RKI9_CERS8|nr:hypothetical protein CERSUDRAFT_112682 [Gelatoporia subvermispora B]
MSATATQSTTTTVAPAPAPSYAFLSQPPPQKKCPTQPLPSPPRRVPSSPCSPVSGRRRSATTSVITAWVANVQPGSPAPYSPRRRPSITSTRRPSISPRIGSRRPSVSSVRGPSASFLNFFDTPTTTASRLTPSVKDFKLDLTAVGYTSVFVHIPTTPSSALPTFRAPPVPPIPKTPARGLKHFRSLSALKPIRNRSKSTVMPSSPSKPQSSKHAKSSKTQAPPSATAVSSSKKHKYAKYRPAPLAAELALAQFADGGSLEDNIKRLTEAKARAGGAVRVDGQLVGVGDVWRDGAGGVWWDQDEEWEYAHLLGGAHDYAGREKDWVRFGESSSRGSVSEAADGLRRGSVSSQDSDLDPRYAMQTDDDLAAYGDALGPGAMRKPGVSVLALPARTRRTAKHLRKPEFLLDSFPVPAAPESAPHTPKSTSRDAPGKTRRRPAPLTLEPPSPAFKCPTNPLDAEEVRREFIENSFAPAPKPAAAAKPAVRLTSTSAKAKAPAPAPTRIEARIDVTVKKGLTKQELSSGKLSTMRGLLRVMGGKKADI